MLYIFICQAPDEREPLSSGISSILLPDDMKQSLGNFSTPVLYQHLQETVKKDLVKQKIL